MDRMPPMARNLGAYFGFSLAFVVVGLGCQQNPEEREGPPTLSEAVTSLGDHQAVIAEALKAKNPSAADEKIHEAMYLADHLPRLETSIEVDKADLEAKASRLLELLKQAHRGAHGGEEGWDPRSVADEMATIVSQLQEALRE